MALQLDIVLAVVDYRLAPETQAPGAAEDGYLAFTYLTEHACEHGIVPDRIGLAGASGGGAPATATALMVRDRGDRRPAPLRPRLPRMGRCRAAVGPRQNLRTHLAHYLRRHLHGRNPSTRPPTTPKPATAGHAPRRPTGADPGQWSGRPIEVGTDHEDVGPRPVGAAVGLRQTVWSAKAAARFRRRAHAARRGGHPRLLDR